MIHTISKHYQALSKHLLAVHETKYVYFVLVRLGMVLSNIVYYFLKC